MTGNISTNRLASGNSMHLKKTGISPEMYIYLTQYKTLTRSRFISNPESFFYIQKKRLTNKILYTFAA